MKKQTKDFSATCFIIIVIIVSFLIKNLSCLLSVKLFFLLALGFLTIQAVIKSVPSSKVASDATSYMHTGSNKSNKIKNLHKFVSYAYSTEYTKKSKCLLTLLCIAYTLIIAYFFLTDKSSEQFVNIIFDVLSCISLIFFFYQQHVNYVVSIELVKK